MFGMKDLPLIHLWFLLCSVLCLVSDLSQMAMSCGCPPLEVPRVSLGKVGAV